MREQFVFLMSLCRWLLRYPVASESVVGVHEEEVVATADLVLQAPHSSQLDKDRLWKLILFFIQFFHILVALRVKLRVNVEDGSILLLRVEHDGTVAARNDVLLLLNTLDQGLNGGSEARSKPLFLHLEFLL